MAIEIVDVPIKHGGSFHSKMLVHQRVCFSCLGLQELGWHEVVDGPSLFFFEQKKKFFLEKLDLYKGKAREKYRKILDHSG